jgi:hypothetical protein
MLDDFSPASIAASRTPLRDINTRRAGHHAASLHAAPTAAILDSHGAIGHEYDAKTTPHMFVIDPTGKLIYEGAIDDHATPNPSDIKESKNYVSDALRESMGGRQVTTSYTRSYGCSIKYAD